MPPVKHVLCPVDFSDGSASAIRYAAFLCKQLGAELTLLHVFEMPSFAVPPKGHNSVATASIGESLRQLTEELSQRLMDAKQGLDTGGLGIATSLRDGNPYRVIVEVARDLGADLIVMGTQGRTGVQRILLGSVAERVVRAAPCPVITVPRGQNRPATEGRAS